MGFFDSLFGNGGRGLTLDDAELGTFKSIAAKDDKVIWKGVCRFLGQDINLQMSGDKERLNEVEKKSLADMLKDEPAIETQIDQGLKEEYENADKEYSTWSHHFNCVAISTSNPEIEISFEEKDSNYLFNVHFLNNRLSGVSVDS